MKKKNMYVWSLVLLIVSVLFISAGYRTAEAAVKIRLNKKSVKIEQQQSVTLRLKGAKEKKVKWSSSDKKIASVKKGVVKAKRVGDCVITAKYAGKKYQCKVTVRTKNPKEYTGTVRMFQGNSGFDKRNGMTVLRTKKELDAYRKALEKESKYSGPEEKKYLKLLGRYDAAYFKKHSLVLISKEEPSGSNRIRFDGITQKDGTYQVKITRILPAIFSCDMAYWQILVETDNKEITEKNSKLQIEEIRVK